MHSCVTSARPTASAHRHGGGGAGGWGGDGGAGGDGGTSGGDGGGGGGDGSGGGQQTAPAAHQPSPRRVKQRRTEPSGSRSYHAPQPYACDGRSEQRVEAP